MILPPHSEFDHRIILKDPSKVHYAPPLPLPHDRQIWLHDQYTKRVRAGWLRPAINCPYSSRSFVIPKKTKGAYREVTDYRALNENTVKDKFPLPRIETVLDNLAASRVYSAIDYKDGYYLIRNAESAEQLTSFYA
ncbi:hypothetical protein RI054_02g08020 [Pseudoscourfieldia marina]